MLLLPPFLSRLRPNNVVILIGANGSGKSRLMRQLVVSNVERGEHVIAIAPTLFDRFQRISQQSFSFFGARLGRSAASGVIRSALASAPENPQILKNLTRALRYTHFDPVVGIRIKNLNLRNFTTENESLDAQEAERLKRMLERWQAEFGYSGVARIEAEGFTFPELHRLAFGKIVQYERLLRRTKTLSKIEILLFREGLEIPLLSACSGELWFILTIAFIATNIRKGSIIAIDEPETSLHPTWQKNYVETLLDLFYHYSPGLVISTHSPIIISGASSSRAETGRSAISVYEMVENVARPFGYEQLSLEEMYDRLFNIITPKNHHLSQRAVSILNALNAGDTTLDRAVAEFETLRQKTYDQSQQGVITQFEQIARRIEATKQRGEE
jgi:hypothetical protein